MNQHCDIACHRLSFTKEEHDLYERLKQRIFRGLVSTEAMIDGFTFVLTDQGTLLHDLADWIPLEHKCCPFLQCTVTLYRDQYVMLTLSGPTEVKHFLLHELGLIQD